MQTIVSGESAAISDLDFNGWKTKVLPQPQLIEKYSLDLDDIFNVDETDGLFLKNTSG